MKKVIFLYGICAVLLFCVGVVLSCDLPIATGGQKTSAIDDSSKALPAAGSYTITNKFSAKILKSDGYAGSSVYNAVYSGAAIEKWSLSTSGSYYKFVNLSTGHALRAGNSGNVTTEIVDNGDDELFSLSDAGSGYFYVIPKSFTSISWYMVDLYDGNPLSVTASGTTDKYKFAFNNLSGGTTTTVPATTTTIAGTTTTTVGTNLVTNPNFDTNTTGWSVYLNPPAAATIASVTQSGYSGKAAKATITNGGTASWHIQVLQTIPLAQGKTYSITFKASADAARTIDFMYQQGAAPQTIWNAEYGIALTTTPKTCGPYSFTCSTTDSTDQFRFLLGNNTSAVYIDDVVISTGTVSSTTSSTVAATTTTVAATTTTTVAATTTTTTTVASGTIWYVSGSGNDINDGKSTGAAFRTLQKAADKTNPGDTVKVLNGTYTANNTAVLNITRSGTSAKYITYIAYPGNNPKINMSGSVWNAVTINASYIVFEGFELEGNNANLTLAGAQASFDDAYTGSKNNWTLYGQYNSNAISIGGPKLDSKLPHHVVIRSCKVHDWSGGGISSIQADYTTIEKNTVYNNAWYMMYAGSGISILNPYNSDHTTGYKNFVRQNICYNNKTLINWIGLNPPRRSDGNGIILDVNQTPYSGGVAPDSLPYSGRTLVENNVSYYNGGSGIHAFEADHVDIINNTAYNNGTEVGYRDIYLGSSHDGKVINNIMYSKPGVTTWTIPTDSTSTYDYNLYFNMTVAGPKGSHSISSQDPKFVALPPVPANNQSNIGSANFRLQSGSPALNTGTLSPHAATDILGNSRPAGSGVDMGAYEN